MRSGCRMAPVSCVLVLGLTVCAQARSSADALNSYEAMRGWSLSQANAAQIELGKEARRRARSADARTFAVRLVEEHAAAEEQVRRWAARRGIDLRALERRLAATARADERELELERRSRAVGSATGEWAFTAEHAARADREARPELETLRRSSGAGFDREFARVVATDHRALVDQLSEASARTSDPELKALVDGLLPACRQHLATAQQLRARQD